MLRRNDRPLGVANGDRGIVTAVDPAARTLDIELAGRTVRLDAGYLDSAARNGPAIQHAYAITGHVAQGLTFRETFVLATDRISREWGYSALSRGRASNRLYAVTDEADERAEYAPGGGHSRASRERLAASLGRSAAQTFATDAGREQRLAAELGRVIGRRDAAADAHEAAVRTLGELERRAPHPLRRRAHREYRQELARARGVETYAGQRLDALEQRAAKLREQLEARARRREAAGGGDRARAGLAREARRTAEPDRARTTGGRARARDNTRPRDRTMTAQLDITDALSTNGLQPDGAAAQGSPPAALSEPLLTADDAAALLRVRRSTVYELARTRRLPHVTGRPPHPVRAVRPRRLGRGEPRPAAAVTGARRPVLAATAGGRSRPESTRTVTEHARTVNLALGTLNDARWMGRWRSLFRPVRSVGRVCREPRHDCAFGVTATRTSRSAHGASDVAAPCTKATRESTPHSCSSPRKQQPRYAPAGVALRAVEAARCQWRSLSARCPSDAVPRSPARSSGEDAWEARGRAQPA